MEEKSGVIEAFSPLVLLLKLGYLDSNEQITNI